VILSVSGTPVSTTGVLSTVLAELKPGQKVQIVVKHQDATKATVQVTLGTLPGA
jgi:PDZ domain-containing secreted protein